MACSILRGAMIALYALLANFSPAQSETLTVGVENINYLPHFAIINGEYVGFGRAIIDAFAASAHLHIEYHPMPVTRLFQEFTAGRVDFKYPDSPQWESSYKIGKRIFYSDPVVDYIDGVLVSPLRLGRPADEIKVLGAVLGFTPWSWRDHIDSGAVTLAENPDFNGLLLQTLRGRIDGAYANIAVARRHLAHQLRQPDTLVFDPSLPHSVDSYRLSTLRRPEILTEFNAWMAANQALLAALKAEHGL